MELGGIKWVRYVPEFGGNRDLPDDERMSLELKRLTAAELLAGDKSADDLAAWRDEKIKGLDGEYAETFKAIKAEHLAGIYSFVTYTRGFRNFLFDGEALDDGLLIALNVTSVNPQKTIHDLVQDLQRLHVNHNRITSQIHSTEGAPLPDVMESISEIQKSLEQSQAIFDGIFNPDEDAMSLMAEVNKAIGDVSALYGEKLKNYAGRHAGFLSVTSAPPAEHN